MKARKFLVLLLSLLLLLVGCSGGLRSAKEIDSKDRPVAERREGGTLHVPLTNIDTLNPLLTENQSYFQLSKLLYDQLFVFEGSGRMIPSLVEHVEVSNGGRRVSLTLRKGIFWEDGTPLTTKDVDATFRAIKAMDAEAPYPRMIRHSAGVRSAKPLADMMRAVIFDARNIDFEFDRPYGNFREMLAFPILPSHLMSTEDMAEKDDFKVTGSGPYIFKKFEKNKKVFLEKNPNYHGNLPYVDEIVGIILSDPAAIRQAYEAEQIDLCVLDDYTWDKYRAGHPKRLEPFESQRVETVCLNTANADLSDPALRKALDFAVNKGRIRDSLYLSQGTIANFFLNPKISGGLFAKEEAYTSTDAAAELLDKAGYKDTNGDGYREKPGGAPLRLSILVDPAYEKMKTEAGMLKDDWAKIGVQCELKTLAVPTEGEAEEGGDFLSTVKSGGYQIAIVGMNFSAAPDLESVLHSASVGEMNLSRYGNPEADRILEKLALTRGEDERRALVQELYGIFQKDTPYIPILFKQKVLIKGDRVQGMLRPNVYNVYNGMDDVYLSEE
ncbi:Putative binding protein ygiS precursor [Aedoeadaptatus ivorii]|uniref:Binding protein ygiS n=1 Tax=Aedoeadaptatus ivorii TaxID=54006 RepID=A0A448V198_9FIRM|nr:peptide ABC transporter substrate-binding protein [Peptoniphilus ivorii]VEJ35331.1 Putative binding protein ygiS precursor [Peptoniphilus ivorii]